MLVRMAKMVQIRNVPDEVHRRLKVRAAQAGMSLSDFLLREVTLITDRLTWEEVAERARQRGGVTISEPSDVAVREARREAGRGRP